MIMMYKRVLPQLLALLLLLLAMATAFGALGGLAGRTDGSGGRVKRSFAKKPAESGFFRQSLTEGNKS